MTGDIRIVCAGPAPERRRAYPKIELAWCCREWKVVGKEWSSLFTFAGTQTRNGATHIERDNEDTYDRAEEVDEAIRCILPMVYYIKSAKANHQKIVFLSHDRA
ncbi:hypothetical protein IW262DRAFT_1302266 [Armillaria fumosa]|nr:hypothetical protein IW262DRAFT_1302266 [Armillaria fumosa]